MHFPDGLKNKKIINSRLSRLYSHAGALIDSLFKVLNWHCFRVLLENYKNHRYFAIKKIKSQIERSEKNAPFEKMQKLI